MVSLIKFLKIIQHILSLFFEELFNLSIETNTFPDDFKVGKVAPVFKSGDKKDLTNLNKKINFCATNHCNNI